MIHEEKIVYLLEVILEKLRAYRELKQAQDMILNTVMDRLVQHTRRIERLESVLN